MSPVEIGVIGLVALLVLLVASLPVAFVMALVGTVGFAAIVSPRAALAVLASDFMESFASYGLTVIPLFVFMGQVCFHAGISGKLFKAANRWFGPLRGGLAMAAVGACAAFGAICGSGPATAATMASVTLPEMRRYKYSPSLAGGVVAAGGGLGMLIPPSVVFIVYGIMTEQSIGKLFMAGVVPGILIALLFCAVVAIVCAIDPSAGPASEKRPLRERLAALGEISETLILFALVIGGMFAGFFTPTEGAAVGAAGSLIVAAISRKLTFRMLARALEETIRTSCMVLIIVAGASVFGHFLAVTEMPSLLAKWLSGLPLPAWAVMTIIGFFYLVAGCFVDSLALVMLTVPIFYPVVLRLGYSPIWFGVLVVVITQMGVITPPVGVNVYVVSGIDRSIPIQTIFRGAMPFLLALFVAAALLIVFPGIATWLPNLAG
ncbi:MAG: TRAP transporter large permease [Kiritimatiellae bacterium]|nr:TRAP transporter large permease [Kiritimatiellia bacterium]